MISQASQRLSSTSTFYLYKITASDSLKYYYGVSHVNKENASVDDCLHDGYYGSGGGNQDNKFRRWKNKHQIHLEKVVISRFPSKTEAYRSEQEIVGDLYSIDCLCLNSIRGGINGGQNLERSLERIALKECSLHGLTKFKGDSCYKCHLVQQS
jgi:hypothetical protein